MRRVVRRAGIAATAALLLGGAAQAGAATYVSSLTNPTPLLDNVRGDQVGERTPYPSSISANAVTGKLASVRVTLHDVAAADADNLAVLLVGPKGQSVELLLDVCDDQEFATPFTFTFSDAAAAPVPTTGTCVPGTFKPSRNPLSGSFDFPHPAPPGPYGNLAGFAGSDPRGIWQLYVVDLILGADNTINGGWTLGLTTTGKACKKAKGERASAAKKKPCRKPKKK